MKVRELLTTWVFDIDTPSLDRMDRKIGDLRNNAKAFGANMKAVTGSMVSQGARLTAFVTVPILGIGAAMVKAASDAEETESKYATVFKEVAAESEIVASELAKNFGLASDTSKKLLSDTGDLLTGFGFTGKSALDLSKSVQELAVDLASFTNFSGGAEGASAALSKALLGERESVKSLGISILEEDVKAKIASLEATGKLTTESDKQKKAIATLAIAVEQSKNAIGDYAKTSGGFANQQKLLGQRIRSLAISFGKILIPFALKAVKAITRLSEKFTGLSKNTKEWIVIGLAVVAVLAPMLLFAGLLGSAILALSSAFILLKGAVIAVRAASLSTLLVWAAIPILIGLAMVAVGFLLDDLWALATGGKSAIGSLITSFTGAKVDLTGTIDTISSALGGLFNWFVILGNIELAIFKLIGDAIFGAFGDLTNLVNGGNSAIGNWLDSLGLVGDVLDAIFIEPIRLIKEFLGYVNELAGNALVKGFNLLTGGGESAQAPGQGLGAGIVDTLGSLQGSINDFFGSANIAQAATLPAATLPALNRAGTTKVNNIAISPTINLEVPAGTTEDQQRILSESVKLASEEIFNTEVRKMINENPEVS